MRTFQWAVTAVAMSGLMGCLNSEPELYRVALSAPPNPLPNTCYRNPPSGPIPDETTNVVREEQWVLWEGVDDARYLDVGAGSISASMGNAPRVNIPVDAIEGRKNDAGKLVFTVERTERDSDETIVTAGTYTFDEVGQTVEGTRTVRSSCTGTGCGATPISCEYSQRFVGRRIDGERFIVAGDTN